MKNIQKFLLMLFVIFMTNNLFANNCFPEVRLVNWNNAGNFTANFSFENWIFVDDFTGSDYEKIMEAISVANNQSGGSVIFFESDVYHVNSTITINNTNKSDYDNLVFMGNFSSDTLPKIIFENVDKDDDCFAISGSWLEETITISKNIEKGDSVIHFDENVDFEVGDWIRFCEPKFNDKYGDHSEYVGQVSQVTSISDSSITIKDVASKYYSSDNEMWIRKFDPVENISFEHFKIERNNIEKGYGETFYFGKAINCRLIGIESYNCTGYHVNVKESSHIEIRGCYIHKATNYDSNQGTGYGVVLGSAVTNCLVENNIFIKNRHAMLVGMGANSNVFGYNFSNEATWDEQYSSLDPGDIRLHGRYPYANLFEGNSVDYVFGDPTHGDNGPYNTFFRNNVRKNDIKLFNTDSSNFGCNYIQNGVIDLKPDWIELIAWPDATTSDTAIINDNCEMSSIYLDAKPSFFLPEDFFPPVENDMVNNPIPSQFRYDTEDILTYYIKENYDLMKRKKMDDIEVDEDSPDMRIDLSEIFFDPNKQSIDIIKTINSNNDSILTCEIFNDTLILHFIENKFGNTNIIISGESDGITLTDTFLVFVNPIDDSPISRNKNIKIKKNIPYYFQDSDFYYFDGDGDEFGGIKITSINVFGTFQYDNNEVLLNTDYNDISKLMFLLDTAATSIFEFKVKSDDNVYSDSTYQIVIKLITDNSLPVFQNSIPDTIIYENTTFEWNYIVNDDDDSLTFTLESIKKDSIDLEFPEEIMYLDTLSGEFLWTPDYNDSGDYEIIMSVNDGEFFVYDTSNIKVVNVNRKPEFVDFLPDTIITNENEFTFTYTATDLDNDSLIFGIKHEIEGLSITNNGKLIWDIPENPENNYSIEIFVTDWIDTTFSIVSITIENVLPITQDLELPGRFYLHQNYPNPFNPSTTINYELKNNCHVIISIYDIGGRKLLKLFDSQQKMGYHSIIWDANVPSGIYLYKIQTDYFSDIKKCILMK